MIKKRIKRTISRSITAVGEVIPPIGRAYRKNRNEHRKKLYEELLEQEEVRKGLVIFESFFGRNYSCSPRAIFEYMVDDPAYKDYRFVWAFRNAMIEDIDNYVSKYPKLAKAEIVRFNSLEYRQIHAQAEYIVTNSRMPKYITKMKPEQKYVQCWHGTPLKRLGHDIKVGANKKLSQEELLSAYDHDAAIYTYMVSPSAYCSEKYRSAFDLDRVNPDVTIIEEGYPRNDDLFNFDDEKVAAIRKEIGIPEDDDRKIIMYAPTWRDDQHVANLGYTYDLQVDFDKWRERLEKDYIILFRAHYFISNSFDFTKYEGFVYDVSLYDEINDLYILSDLLITDYSSVFFDYANLKRPMLFYMYDKEQYQGLTRDFYIDLEELPGEIITEEDRLLDAIDECDYSSFYDERYKAFNDKYNYLDDGRAAERVVKKIFGQRGQ